MSYWISKFVSSLQAWQSFYHKDSRSFLSITKRFWNPIPMTITASYLLLSSRIAACNLSSQLYLLDSSSLSISSAIELRLPSAGKKDSGHAFSHVRFGVNAADNNSLFAVSPKQGIFLWDIRSAQQPVLTFKCDSIASLGLNFLSLDINCDGRLLAAGSSATPQGDAFIGFWDVRLASNGAFLGTYSDSHSNDITALAFHPSSAGHLLSGAGDGLLCRFDLNARKEDDALSVSCNCERSLARVGWHASDMFGISDMDTFHKWDFDGNVLQERTTLPKAWQYIVDCLPDGETLLVGKHDGDLAILSTKHEEVSHRLPGGHSDTVRSALITSQGDLITGGEDSLLCLWRNAKDNASDPPTKKRKLGSPSPSKRRKVSELKYLLVRGNEPDSVQILVTSARSRSHSTEIGSK